MEAGKRQVADTVHDVACDRFKSTGALLVTYWSKLHDERLLLLAIKIIIKRFIFHKTVRETARQD